MTSTRTVDDDLHPRTRGLAGWLRRQPVERKLPAAFVALLTLVGAFYTGALYREVERSAGDAVLLRLEQVGNEVAQLAATGNTQRIAAMRRAVDSVGAVAALGLMSNDTIPAVLLDQSLRVVRQSGSTVSAQGMDRLIRDAAFAREQNANGFAGALYTADDRVYYWVLAATLDTAGGPAFVASRRQINPNATGSSAIQTLIGETTVLIANAGSYEGPWLVLEGPQVEPATPPEPGANRHFRSGTLYRTYTASVAGSRWAIITETRDSVIRKRAADFATSTIPFMLGFIVLGGALAWIIGKRITRPMRVLANAALAIGSGEYHRRVKVREAGDLGMMAHAFNRMAAQVERTNSELDERVRQRTAELELVNNELQAFSYSVSHDLRSPLRSIDGFSQALLEDYGPQLDKTAQDYLRRLRGGAQRMGLLIDDLLMLSRVSRQPIERCEIDVSALASEVIAELQSSESKRDIDVLIQDGLTAWADRGLFYVILQNLIGNAWKFTANAASPRIEIGSVREDDATVFFVRDNGAGFDMAYAHQLFTPFQRLHSNSEFKGTGIGLTTVQRVVTRHGGRVWAEAVLGQGASFYFTIEGGEHGVQHDPPG